MMLQVTKVMRGLCVTESYYVQFPSINVLPNIWLPYFFRTPNPGLQNGQILDPEKPVGDPRYMKLRIGE